MLILFVTKMKDLCMHTLASKIIKFFEINKRAFIFFTIILYVFALFPGKGGVEGQQQHIDLISERTDNWGFFTALLGDWPNFFGYWQFSLSLVQVFLFWCGLLMLFFDTKQRTFLHKILFYSLLAVSTVFVSQLWRDATLLSIVVFGLGIHSVKKKFSRYLRVPLSSISICLIFIGITFKPIYGGVVAIIYLWLEYHPSKSDFWKTIKLISLVIFFSVLPFFVDKNLSDKYNLIKVYPEQQPIIFDLASNFCWGAPEELVANAELGLKLVIKQNYPIQSICSALRPNRWDNLHSDVNNWQFSSPILRIDGAARTKDVQELTKYWVNMIKNSPIDWIQVKSLYLGPTLIMSNSFIPQNESRYFPTAWGSISHTIWKGLQFFPILLDKIRVTSLGFAFLLVFLVIFLKGVRTESGSVKKVLADSSNEIFALSVLITTLIITLIGFVASNGRYVLPYIIMTYIMLLRNSMEKYK